MLNNSYFHLTIELLAGFVILFFIIKILGKSQISQLDPLDFISAVVIGNLVGDAIFDKEATVFHVLYALVIWGILMYGVKLLTQKKYSARQFLEGKPSLVIRNGLIEREALKANKINIDQLQSLLRQKNIFSIKQVEYAVLEEDGSLSVLPKSGYSQPTRDDLGLSANPVVLPITVITDGEVAWDNLSAFGLGKDWLEKQMEAYGIDRPEDVLYAEWVAGEGLYVQMQEQ
ncbi:MAG: DUF421 domain-containing protein [Syntrophomonadaceae bacterium]